MRYSNDPKIYEYAASYKGLIFTILSSSIVFLIAYWPAIINPYVINDDVRQQIYWMQRWIDPELYPEDLLSKYAQNYVPWGVQAVYWLGSFIMNPVQFTKVVTGILFVVNSLFIYGLGTRFRDERYAVILVTTSFFFTSFLWKISGGLSQGFAFPLMLGYLYYLQSNKLMATGLILFLQSLFNPYTFLICLVSHCFYYIWNFGSDSISVLYGLTKKLHKSPDSKNLRAPLFALAPVLLGVVVMAAKYMYYSPAEFGRLVTRAQMSGNIEYSALGRYEIYPQPSFLYELIRPLTYLFPIQEKIWLVGYVAMFIFFTLQLLAWTRRDKKVNYNGFSFLGYLLPASFVLYAVSSFYLAQLFLPERYLELSLNIAYLFVFAYGFKILLDGPKFSQFSSIKFCSPFAVVAGIFVYGCGTYNYSQFSHVYNFVNNLPKNVLIAGNPKIMDNVMVFGKRNAFVTYELSHTWLDKYWSIIKKRNEDFFQAYYADEASAVADFASYYGIQYIIVSAEDFDSNAISKNKISFEPFNSQIQSIASGNAHFALLSKSFPVVYERDGLKILRVNLQPL